MTIKLSEGFFLKVIIFIICSPNLFAADLTPTFKMLDELGTPPTYNGQIANCPLVVTQAYFGGQLSIQDTSIAGKNLIVRPAEDKVILHSVIYPDFIPVGEIVDIVMFTERYVYGELIDSFTFDGETWHPWNNFGWKDFSQLLPITTYEEGLTYPTVHDYPLAINQYSSLEGEFAIYMGYRLRSSGVTFYSKEPFRLWIANGGITSAQDNKVVAERAYIGGYLEVYDASQGRSLIRDATIIKPEDEITLTGKIIPVNAHLGQPAQLFIVLGYRSPDGKTAYFTKSSQATLVEKLPCPIFSIEPECLAPATTSSWQKWVENDLNSLKMIRNYDSLPEQITLQEVIDIHELPLDEPGGEYYLYLGYQLNNGTLVFNEKPRQFLISNTVLNTWGYSYYYPTDRPAYIQMELINEPPALVRITLYPDNYTINTSARLMVVAMTGEGSYYQWNGRKWVEWLDSELFNLLSARSYTNLPEVVKITVPLPVSLGKEFFLYSGYSITGASSIIYNDLPFDYVKPD
ncbi:hypothetical protein THII_1157 [Thioploca ingrica]|uniref:Uncharacterized protein n=1 Tax=Thioploca ingrica TaxID=40754 RepID=A0A090AER4_9GAMM|nr:hypothetical protein THII_1157 [Thioploca ingrica]